MARYLHCPSCAESHRGIFHDRPADPDGHPTEYCRRVDGRARRDIRCDSCNAAIGPGDAAVAWTVWTEGRPVTQWEDEYLDLSS